MSMDNRLIQALDDILAGLAQGESLEVCIARYPDLNTELTGLIETREQLRVLAAPPALSAASVAARRRQFITAARTIKSQAVSGSPFQCLVGWILPSRRKEQPVWIPVLARAALAFVIVLSLLSGTVVAAQASLPDSPLYGIKLAWEDVRLNLADDPAQQAMLALALAAERAREIEKLAAAKQPVNEQVAQRLQAQLDLALTQAARVGEPEMPRVLDQIRVTTQTQEQILSQVQRHTLGNAQDVAQSAQQAMAQARQKAEAGLADPQTFRNLYRHGEGGPVEPTPTPDAAITSQPPTPTATVQTMATPQPIHTPYASATPQRNQFGPGQTPTNAPGPRATVTPQPAGPDLQPASGQGSPGLQPTPRPGGGVGGDPGSGSGGSGSSGGGNSGGSTHRP